jgi:hypothetical protein
MEMPTMSFRASHFGRDPGLFIALGLFTSLFDLLPILLGALHASLFNRPVVLLKILGIFASKPREEIRTAKLVLGEIEIKEGILAKFGHEFSVVI